MRRAALLMAVAVLLAACTRATPGTAQVAPVPSLGSRPREIRLDGRDPCSLLTSSQATTLGLEDDSRSRFTSVPPAPGSGCLLVGFEPRAIGVALVLGTKTSLTDLRRPGAVSDDLTPINMRGFPAVLARPRNPRTCYIDIDVAVGEVLDVAFSDGGRLPPIAQDELCRDVVGVADEAMRTLLMS